MKLRIILALIAIGSSYAWKTGAQTYETNNVTVQTFAGSAFYGYLDGQGTLTMFDGPSKIVADSIGNLFVMDVNNHRIRKITPDAMVTTFAGGGGGNLPGYGTNISLDFSSYSAMTVDRSNTIWLVVSPPTYIYRIASDGYTSRIIPPNIFSSSGVCVDSVNNIYYSGGNKIYRWLTNGTTEVFVGSGNAGSIDGNGVFTSFNSPTQLAADAADNIYVWDGSTSVRRIIRRVNQNRDVVTIAGSGTSDIDGTGTNASFSTISAMTVDNYGNLILACGSSIRKMSAATNVTTFAGGFSQPGYVNGLGNVARFSGASGVCLSQGSIFVADPGNYRIRQISFNPSAQVVSNANLGIGTFAGVTITGTVGRAYQVQSSPDMTNWITRATLLLTSSPYLWTDLAPVSGNKFYRALMLP